MKEEFRAQDPDMEAGDGRFPPPWLGWVAVVTLIALGLNYFFGD